MALIDKKIIVFANPVTSLPDHPSQSGMTAAQLKATFDANATGEIKSSINGIVDDLVAVADGASGADNIGATAIKAGGATTVQGQLEQIQIEKIGLAGDETISGVKTFSAAPIIPAPGTNMNPATKKYVDDLINSTAGIADAVKLGGQLPAYYAKFEDVGDKSTLATTIKTNLVAAVNELKELNNNLVAEENADLILGTELLDATGWTATGWTGDFVTGFIHTVGQSASLIRTIGNTGQNMYLVEFDVESPTNTGSPDASVAFTVSIGNSPRFAVYRSTGNQHFAFGITSISNGDLKFIPCNPASLADDTSFDGTIKNISLKQITGVTATNIVKYDKNDVVSSEERQTDVSLFNTFLGIGAGKNNYNGDGNSAFGVDALRYNTSGFWNTAIGKQALMLNTVGSRNISIGVYALKNHTSGNRNIAIGTFALEKNVDGCNNIAIGADAMQYQATSKNNIAIGMASLGASAGNDSIAIGMMSAGSTNAVDNLIAIGNYACEKTTGNFNIGIGLEALKDNVTGAESVAIGHYALRYNKGTRNTAIGYLAGQGVSGGASGNYNVFIGRNAGASSQGGDNTMIGYGAGASATTGAANILIGKNAGSNLTTGAGNIIIGNDLTAPAVDSYDYLNIGNYVYGRKVSSKSKVGIGVQVPSATLHLGASDGTAYTAPLKISAGTLLASIGVADSGSIEYDGTNLYFINSSGVRKTIAVV